MVAVIARPKQHEKDPLPVAGGRLRLHQSYPSTIAEILVLAFADHEYLQPIDKSPAPCVWRASPARATHAAEAPLFCRRVAATAAPDGSCECRDKHQCRS